MMELATLTKVNRGTSRDGKNIVRLFFTLGDGTEVMHTFRMPEIFKLMGIDNKASLQQFVGSEYYVAMGTREWQDKTYPMVIDYVKVEDLSKGENNGND